MLGLALRLAVPVLGRLLLPVPLIGGFIGLAAGPHGFDIVPRATMAIWATLPSILITFVFAGLFLGVACRRRARSHGSRGHSCVFL